MGYKIISGTVFDVEASSSVEAWEIFARQTEGTASTEDQSKITDTGETAFEVRVEGEAVIEPEA